MAKIIKPNLPEGGIHAVEGEVMILMTAMRRGVRWSSHSHQDEDQDRLMKGLSNLKQALNKAKHLSSIDPEDMLSPFLEIIKSEETTGIVTRLALLSVKKFISYGLIDSENSDTTQCVEAIADAVTHARFVGTDASADGVVLMKILEVLRTLVLSPPGDYLSNESICEIMLSCFRICFETRLTEILRKTAENCLKDMVQYLFIRLPQFADDTKGLLNMKKMRTDSIENTKSKPKKVKNLPKPKGKINLDVDKTESQLMSPVEKMKVEHLATTPITPAGNIVDMQGSLNQITPEKVEDDKVLKIEKTETKEAASLITECNEKETSVVNTNESSINECNIKIYVKEVEDKSSGKVTLENQLKSLSDDKILPKNKVDEVNTDEQNASFIQSPVGSVEDLSIDDSNNEKQLKIKSTEEAVNEYDDTDSKLNAQHTPYGSLCIRELFRFLVSLCSPIDKQNTEIMIHLGLNLLQVTLEVSADSLSNFPSLLGLIKDDLCRNIILLLGTERLSILAANLQVSFLLFESQREHLKFQLEQFIVKLMDIVNFDSNRISYEQRELALEAIVRLWRIPGLPAELFLNYDCGLYSINLYEDLMKMFSKNTLAVNGTLYSMQHISLDAIFTLVEGLEARCNNCTHLLRSSRYSATPNPPTRQQLLETKSKKRLLAIGAEKFNESPRAGIAKLSENNLLGGAQGNPDPEEIAKFLRENPTLDKKAIGEYLSKKENTNVLDCFVHSFNFNNTRIDEALRQYLESFRLPGEAPLIFLLLEKFADHWHESNGKPFPLVDAAFQLAYAIIMLNVDQHNHNVKKQNIPMTNEAFKKMLKNIGVEFDQDMVDEIYEAIKNEEIVMPAEQTGLVKENYLWKCLLSRGNGSQSEYIKVGNSGEFIDKDLAEHAWAPIISALCRAYNKAPDRPLQRKIAQAFLSCAAISAHYSMTSDLDTLIVSLCKYTGLLAGEPEQVVLQLGSSGRSQLATRTLFKITHEHGNALRASWKNVIDSLQMLFKAKLLPKNMTEGEDFLESSGKISLIRESAIPKPPPVEQGILSSLYSYIALDTSRASHPDEELMKKRATECIENCNIKQIIEESKFLQLDSLEPLIQSLVSVNPQDESISVFLLEILLDVTIQNRDRVASVWPIIQPHLDALVTTAARENHPFLLERVSVGMLRLAIRLLRGEDFADKLLTPLIPLTSLPSTCTPPLSRQIAYGLFQLLKIGAANIHTTEDWKIIFNLLESSGAGALQPKQYCNNSDVSLLNKSNELVLDPRPTSPIREWVLVSPTGTEAKLPVAADTIILNRDFLPHDPISFVKCCESLTFLVRDVAHVTPFNFELCINCVRTFAEACFCSTDKKSRTHVSAEEPANYQQSPVQLLELMHTLHTKTAQVFKWWAEEGEEQTKCIISSLWPQAWRPLLQGIARLCCDSRRAVRTVAIAYLQSTLLAHDLSQLSAVEWSQCLEQVLFPLLTQLLGPISINDPLGVEETRVRVAMLLSKVFLHHLNQLLTLPSFLPLWLTVLDLLRDYMHADNSELLFEAIPESLKNMLLVMSSANVLRPESYLWTPTWREIHKFLPNLKSDLFPDPPAELPSQNQASQQCSVINLVGQQNLSFPKPIPLKPEEQKSLPKQSPPVDNHELYNENKQTIEIDENNFTPVRVISPIPVDAKETKTNALVNQQISSASAPAAVQTSSQQNIINYQTAIQMTNDINNEIHQQITSNNSFQNLNKYATSYPNEFQQSKPISDLHSPKHCQNSQLSPSKESQYLEPTVVPTHCSNDSKELSNDTAIFNSAAYFSEDPGSDNLFVVTSP